MRSSCQVARVMYQVGSRLLAEVLEKNRHLLAHQSSVENKIPACPPKSRLVGTKVGHLTLDTIL